jgi:hypothetical protein
MAPIKSPRKTVSRKPKTAKTIGPGRKKVHTSTLLKSLPESVEHIEIVQQVAYVLEELQKRVLDVKAEASKELKKLMKRYESNYKGLEKKVHQVTSEAKKQAQTSMIQLLQKWHEHKEKLPQPMAKEIEKIIGQIGAKVTSTKTSPKKSVEKTRSKTATMNKRAMPPKRKAPAIKPKAATPAPRMKATSAVKTIPTQPMTEPQT